MENKSILKAIQPIIFVFVIITILIFACKTFLQTNGFNVTVLACGNLLLFLVSACSFVLYQRGLVHASTQGFLRNVYSGMMLKLFVCMIAAFAYVFAARQNVNKPALFACMGMYLVYTFFEMRSVLQLSKQQKKNA